MTMKLSSEMTDEEKQELAKEIHALADELGDIVQQRMNEGRTAAQVNSALVLLWAEFALNEIPPLTIADTVADIPKQIHTAMLSMLMHGLGATEEAEPVVEVPEPGVKKH